MSEGCCFCTLPVQVVGHCKIQKAGLDEPSIPSRRSWTLLGLIQKSCSCSYSFSLLRDRGGVQNHFDGWVYTTAYTISDYIFIFNLLHSH